MGATELQCGLVECAEGAGFHNPTPELFHLASVDGDGVPVPDGDTGRLVLTHLDRRGTVLLRFWLGDLVRFTNDPCGSCGRGGGLILQHLGRGGNFVKIRGNLVDLSGISNAVSLIPHVIEHQIVIQSPKNDPMGLDELVIRIVTDTNDPLPVTAGVQTAVTVAADMTPQVELVDLDTIWSEGPHMKPARVLDRRNDA
jgi:phenylacetate-CoA ligase